MSGGTSSIRRARRALSQQEVDWLLQTTASATDATSRRCGIKPADRAMMYAVGLATGFRRGALLSLTPESFVVGPKVARPLIRLAPRNNKNRKPREQPIPRSVADQLHDWLKGKSSSKPVWNPLPHADLGHRFRRELERARTAWIGAAADPAERGRREQSHTLCYVYHNGIYNVFADFHALRHTGITFVVRGAGLRVAQVWALAGVRVG